MTVSNRSAGAVCGSLRMPKGSINVELNICCAPRLSVARSAALEPLLSGDPTPPQPETLDHYYHQHTLFRLGQYPLQYDHRHRHRRPAGRELRNLPAGRRQSAQGRQKLHIAGGVGTSGSDHAPRCDDTPKRRSPPANPTTELPMGGELSSPPPSGSILVQLQRQSSASALADGLPVVCGVLVAGPRHTARLPAL